jgi:hypothetical protein
MVRSGVKCVSILEIRTAMKLLLFVNQIALNKAKIYRLITKIGDRNCLSLVCVFEKVVDINCKALPEVLFNEKN